MRPGAGRAMEGSMEQNVNLCDHGVCTMWLGYSILAKLVPLASTTVRSGTVRGDLKGPERAWNGLESQSRTVVKLESDSIAQLRSRDNVRSPIGTMGCSSSRSITMRTVNLFSLN